MISEERREQLNEKFFAEMRDTFFFQVHRIQKQVFRIGNRIFQEAKIPLQWEQFPMLLTVHAMEGLSQQEIADITHRDKSSIQRTLVALEKKGFLNISQDAADKRRNVVYATDAGKYMAEKIKDLMKKTETETFSVLSNEERTTAIVNMKELADKLSAERTNTN